MAKINISITDALKARMDAIPQQDLLRTWSGVAAEAFEKELADILVRTSAQARDRAIQRLRVSRLESKGRVYTEGFEEGQRWAESRAEWDALARLAEAGGNWANSEDYLGSLAKTISPEDITFESTLEEIAEDAEVEPTRDFYVGFAAGAVHVFESVREHVEGE